MKRLLSIFIAVVMLFSCVSIITASAEVSEETIDNTGLCASINAYCDSVGHTFWGENGKIEVTDDNVRDVITIYSEKDGIVVFGISGYADMIAEQVIGDYKFTASTWFTDSDNLCGYCVYTNSNTMLYTLAAAVSHDVMTVEELAEIIPGTTLVEKEPEPTVPEESFIETQEFCDALNLYFTSIEYKDYNNEIMTVSPENVANLVDVYSEEGVQAFGIIGNMPMFYQQIVGNYEFNSANRFDDANNPCGYGIYHDGVVYTISNAVEQGIVTDYQLAQVFPYTLISSDYAQQKLTSQHEDNTFNLKLIVKFIGKSSYAVYYNQVTDTPVDSYQVEVGDYVFTLASAQEPYDLGIYVLSDDVYTLQQAYELGIVDMDKLYEYIKNKFDIKKKSSIIPTDPTVPTDPTDPEETAPEISKTTLFLKAGKTKSLTVRDGEVAKWKSSDKTVAKVKDGKVTALKKGEAVITAVLTDGTKLKCVVAVTTNPTLKKEKLTLKVSNSKKIKVKGAVGKVKYTSKNTKIATVNKNGKIKAKKAGTTKIKVKVNGIKLTCKVNVKK